MTEEQYSDLKKEAEQFIENNETEKAISIYKHILEYFPKDGSVFFDLGSAYHILCDYTTAIDFFNKCIANDNNQDSGYAYAMLGICYMSLSELSDSNDTSNEEQAVAHYEKVIHFYPEIVDDRMLYDLGLAYIYTNNYENAIVVLKRVVEIDRSRDDAFIKLGSLFSVLGDLNEAINYILQAIELNDKESDYFYTLGQTYGSLGKFNESIEAYKKAIDLNSDDFKSYCNIADGYNKIEEYEKAIEFATKAIEIYSDDIYAICTLAESYEALNQFNKAKELYQQTLQIDPNFKDAIDRLNRIE